MPVGFKWLTPGLFDGSYWFRREESGGDAITAKLTQTPGNNVPIGGLKVVASGGGCAARPSGTENNYKIYAETFQSEAHLKAIVNAAREIVNHALAS